ncbi:MAG TPA: YbhB/YbcL family Raf kinase inhibitor-like protein [Spirochaetota bacterium]|nr:YbhB/YbcL family Raf kinase inhibitor-like protein [Spirochaetota bacterium]
MRRVFFLIASLLVLTLAANTVCAKDKKKEGKPVDLTVESSAFQHGGMIPVKYTCDGTDVSPPITWTDGPEGTKSYAIICDDPDAPVGTWVHWVIYDIPPDVSSLPEAVPSKKALDNGADHGTNDFKRYGYGGPCPPGGTHRYFFKVYALDALIGKGPGLKKKELLRLMEGHIVAKGELIGKYSRR